MVRFKTAVTVLIMTNLAFSPVLSANSGRELYPFQNELLAIEQTYGVDARVVLSVMTSASLGATLGVAIGSGKVTKNLNQLDRRAQELMERGAISSRLDIINVSGPPVPVRLHPNFADGQQLTMEEYESLKSPSQGDFGPHVALQKIEVAQAELDRLEQHLGAGAQVELKGENNSKMLFKSIADARRSLTALYERLQITRGEAHRIGVSIFLDPGDDKLNLDQVRRTFINIDGNGNPKLTLERVIVVSARFHRYPSVNVHPDDAAEARGLRSFKNPQRLRINAVRALAVGGILVGSIATVQLGKYTADEFAIRK
jgi:hypothetical protein